MRDCSWALKPTQLFPILGTELLVCASDRTSHLPRGGYNCIAFAAGDTSDWWWPSGNPQESFWPNQAPVEETLAAFIAAFSTRGYAECTNGDFETGFEKVAIYCLGNAPKHAARMLPNGDWVSKMGSAEDESGGGTIDPPDEPPVDKDPK